MGTRVLAVLTLLITSCGGSPGANPDSGALRDRISPDRVAPDATRPDVQLDRNDDVTGFADRAGDAVPAKPLTLPSPTGSYGIGTQVRTLVDSTRTDPQAPNPNSARKLAVQIHYPTDPNTSGTMPPYLQPLEAATLGQKLPGLQSTLPPGWELLVLTHEHASPPVASSGAVFPVVLFSHGMTSLRGIYMATIEELVSHGFVVIAISHTYDTMAVVFPDGTSAGLNKNWSNMDQHIGVWVADARFVLDQVTLWAQNDPLLAGRLDVAHVGMYGHSFGGAASAEVCALDSRFKAGADFDGGFPSPVRGLGGRTIPVPFMIQLAADHGTEPSISNTYNKLSTGYKVTIDGTMHMTFCDLGLVYDHIYGAGTNQATFGKIDPSVALTIINAYTLAFFKKHLSGTTEPLLDGPTPYPQVTFSKR